MTQRVTIGGLPVGGQEPLISTAVRWGDLLFLSGRAPIDTETLQVVSDDFEEQARMVLDDIVAALGEAGSDADNVLHTRCYLARAGDFAVWNRLWSEYFSAPRPARTTVVTEFTVPGMLIEVEVTAGIPGAAP
jgi:2-iminobutanoate/2-iminopropanoate deaminase